METSRIMLEDNRQQTQAFGEVQIQSLDCNEAMCMSNMLIILTLLARLNERASMKQYTAKVERSRSRFFPGQG